MNIRTLVIVAISIMSILSGCATQKQWSAVGGSRSDGTIRIGYSYGLFEKPEIEQGQGAKIALEKCRIWGYTGAELFGSAMQKCTSVNGYGNCIAWFVYADFQCTTAVGAPPLSSGDSVAQTVGCGSDKDCKGDRVCVMGKCVSQENSQNVQGVEQNK